MQRLLMIICLVLGTGAGGARAGETYDLLFKTGTLSGLAAPTGSDPAVEVLRYDHASTGTAVEPSSEPFQVGLKNAPDDVTTMSLHQGAQARPLGDFKTSVGNPIIMYFMETTLTDMATLSGGSPFYIRNRIKEALLEPAEIVPVNVSYDGSEVAAQQITLRPFAHDKARDRMGHFADLNLTVTVSDKIPGWYYALLASAPEDKANAVPAYGNSFTLDPAPEVTR